MFRADFHALLALQCNGGIDCLCCQVECYRKDEQADRQPRLSLHSQNYQLPQGESYMCIVDHEGNLTKILPRPPQSPKDLSNSALVAFADEEKVDFPSARSLQASGSPGSLGWRGAWGNTPPVTTQALPSDRSLVSLSSAGRGSRHNFPAQLSSRSLPVNNSAASLSSRSHHTPLPPLSARSLPSGAFRAKPMGLIPITKDPWSRNSDAAKSQEKDHHKRSRSIPVLGSRGKVCGIHIQRDSAKSTASLTAETTPSQSNVPASVQSQLSSDTFGTETQRGGRRMSAWEAESDCLGAEGAGSRHTQSGQGSSDLEVMMRSSIMKGAHSHSPDKQRTVRVGWDAD